MKLRYLWLLAILSGLALFISPTVSATAVMKSPIAAGSFHTLAIQKDGSLYAWGRNDYGQLGLGDTTSRNLPTRVGTARNWVAVATGYLHSLALQADGTLWAWGDNAFGKLGLGDNSDRPSQTKVPRFNAPRCAVIPLN